MAKLIEEIVRMSNEDANAAESAFIAILSEHREEIASLLDLLRTANEGGVFTFLKAFFVNKGESLQDLTEEMARPKNVMFVRNLMTVYTLLSSINPDVVRPFMQNLASAVDNAPSFKDRGGMGLLALRSQMKDPDVTAGLRVLFEVAKGFTGSSKRKD